ncbi:MAG: hypothetical protein BroJett021_14240 [Chloroflexota bacterium]|nr:MAG: hypothetical protein BroJett021_14240 [Chloroflexota bacterium]
MNDPIRILLVDDSFYFLDAARDFFQFQDMLARVDAAANEEEAIAQSMSLQPDVILLDLNLGQASGLDLIPIFKEQLPETRIIVLTMMAEEGYHAAALQAGADGFVHKSSMVKTLVNAILETMRHTPLTETDAQGFNAAVHAEQAGDYLQRLATHSPDLIYRYEFTPQRGFTYVSPSAAAVTGYTPQEHYADPELGFKLIHPDDLPILEQIVRGDFNAQQAFELRWVRKDGTILWTEQRNVKIFNEAGELIAIEGIARDITERKQMEGALRSSELFAQKTLDALTANIAILDETGVIVAVNRSWRAFARANGIDPALVSEGVNYLGVCDAARGKNAQEAFAVAAGIRAVLRGEQESCQIEYPCHAPGEQRWFVARVTRFSEGATTRVVVAHENITERKLAEQTIAASEERYRQIFESNPQPMWVYDLETLRFLAVNDAAIVHYGYSREEFLNMTLRDIRPAEDIPALMQNIANETSVIQNSTGWRHRLKDGRLIDVEITSHVLNFEGRPARWVMVNDVTERKRAEATLRLQSAALEAAANAIVITDVNGAIQWINSAYTRLTGYSSAEVIGKNPRILSSGKHDAAFYKNLWETILAGKSWHGELINKRKDGSLYDEEQTITPISDHAGRITHFIGIKQDITNRKQAAAKIRQQMLRLAALRKIDQTIASNLDLHVSLNVLLEQAVELLAVDAAAVLLLNVATNTLEFATGVGFWTDAIQSVSVPFGVSHAGMAALERRHIQLPNLADDPDNFLHASALKEEGFVSYHAAPLIIEDRVVGVLEAFNRSLAAHDTEWTEFLDTLAGQAAIAVENARLYAAAQHELAERTRAEAELRILNKELEKRVEERTLDLKRLNLELERALRIKDEFLANMSHELRTPLTAIIGLSEILTEQIAGPLNEKQQKYISIINENGSHLLELINDILDIVKSEAGRLTLDYTDVDIDALCQASVRMVAELSMKKQQNILYHVDADIGQIWADQRRLKQMLVNLLSNAVKFTPENGKIGLEVKGNQEDNTVSFTVWDTGIGIRAEDLPQLFRPFVQLDAGIAHKTGGTGLGLALVAKLVRLHDGHVSVESEPGKGSRFTITLPWRAPLAVAKASEKTTTIASDTAKPAATPGATILLVEDTESTILVLKEYLEHAGYRVEVAHDGNKAIEQAKKLHPDLFLIDVQMPVVDGLETTRRLRKEPEFRDAPIIALTALAMPNDRTRCLDAGMDEHLTKPVNLKTLLGAISKTLSRRVQTDDDKS